MRKIAALILVLGSGAGGCFATLRSPPPAEREVEVVGADDPRIAGAAGRPLVIPFGKGQDGTQLLVRFLEQAQKSGAHLVSDLRIILPSTAGGGFQECETRLVARKPGTGITTESRVIPGHTAQVSRMVPVTRTVTETENHCENKIKPVNRLETTYETQYDYYSKSYRSVPVTRHVTRYETHWECSPRYVTRSVTRYEHQLAYEFIPPMLEVITRTGSGISWGLGEPTCRPRAPEAGQVPPAPAGRIEGVIYGVPAAAP